MSEVTIRRGRAADAPQLAALSTELGYPSSAEDIERRLPPLLASAEHLVLVAIHADDVAIGWLHATVRRLLESEAFVQVVGLVVGSEHRGAGIGARLLAEAEAWAREVDVPVVRIRSNVARQRAHAFYLRAGYTLAKTSHLFVKRLGERLQGLGGG